MAVIEVDKVTKRFPDGTEAVHEADFTVADGEFFILVGPSGCGKSTLLNMIVGLEDVSDGTLKIGDRVVNDIDPKDRNLAMVFQNYALYPHMTVRENMAFPLRLKKLPADEITKRVDEAARVLELTELLERKPAAMSGGQRQRVAMGRAIVREPDAFLFDEPLSNLDAKLRVQMRTEISRLQNRFGTTTVYVTHDQTEAMTLADRVAVMRKGIVQQVASPRQLYNSPVNLFVAGFIGSPAMNFMPAELDGDTLKLPIGDVTLPAEVTEKLGGQSPGRLVAGIRPEHFADAALVGDDADQGVTFRANVDVIEWMGSELYVYFDVPESADVGLEDIAAELGTVEVPGAAGSVVARLDAASRVAEGEEAELWLDIRRIHLFDPDSGANLTAQSEDDDDGADGSGAVR
ncbi:MAG: sn-glycerol-3-phosphate ABC transporter ATP-binding protein UgpC [Actinomycetota bacterium]|nr:sn-glycerol-3-phosphate ABC transporter ATP-binding protein UgpC [Actinomycetota bacterium]